MTEVELWNLAISNRQVYGLYNIGYGVLSIAIIFIAYVVRHQPKWFRGISAAIAVFAIFNTFISITGSQNAFFFTLSQLSAMAASGNADFMAAALANGAEVPTSAAGWMILGPISMLAHAALSVYLFVMADWGSEKA
jgi:hypothetical protein